VLFVTTVGMALGGAFLRTAFIGIFFPDLTRASRSRFCFSASKRGFTFWKEAESIVLDEVLASTPASFRRRRRTSLVTSFSLASVETRFFGVSVIFTPNVVYGLSLP